MLIGITIFLRMTTETHVSGLSHAMAEDRTASSGRGSKYVEIIEVPKRIFKWNLHCAECGRTSSYNLDPIIRPVDGDVVVTIEICADCLGSMNTDACGMARWISSMIRDVHSKDDDVTVEVMRMVVTSDSGVPKRMIDPFMRGSGSEQSHGIVYWILVRGLQLQQHEPPTQER